VGMPRACQRNARFSIADFDDFDGSKKCHFGGMARACRCRCMPTKMVEVVKMISVSRKSNVDYVTIRVLHHNIHIQHDHTMLKFNNEMKYSYHVKNTENLKIEEYKEFKNQRI
jgi:hypothetical protein